MGYDAHITRAQRWTESEHHPITEGEWRACLADDPELELVGAVETGTADGVLRYESPGLTAWRGHPSGDAVWFDYRDGEVVVKNPDDATLTKMIAVARALGACVEGDASERYEAPEQAYDPEPPLPSVTLFDRLASWVARKSQPASEQLAAPFRAGERVKDAGNHAGR